MKPKFFSNRSLFRKWLENNHNTKKELIVGFYRVDSGRKSITWPEAVDEAICFGWIDSIRRKHDDISYTNRFTPRNPKSNWSLININKVEQLTKLGLMRPAGLEVFNKFKKDSKHYYSYETGTTELDKSYINTFRKNKKAWSWFSSMPPSYRKICARWVMTAKQEQTRVKRLGELISDSEKGVKIKSLRFGDNRQKKIQ